MSNFFKELVDDLKNKPWPAGTTTEYKNKYREKVAVLCIVGAVALLFTPFPWAAVVPAGIAAWKFKIVLTDK